MTISNIDIDKAGWSFDNTYAKLPDDFLAKQTPVTVKSPELIILNQGLSQDLNLDFTNIRDESLSQLFSGNLLPEGSKAIAQAFPSPFPDPVTKAVLFLRSIFLNILKKKCVYISVY